MGETNFVLDDFERCGSSIPIEQNVVKGVIAELVTFVSNALYDLGVVEGFFTHDVEGGLEIALF